MTDPITVTVASLTAGLAASIAFLMRPRVPELDGERWFKVMLTALVTGRSDASELSDEDWVVAVLAAVPYHPAGRFPEKKVHRLGLAGLPAALPGERALIEKLASLETLEERWAWMYDQDELALGARMDDPAMLGKAYDPSTVLGPAATWKALVGWTKGESTDFPQALARKELTWVLVGEDGEAPAVLEALDELVPKTVRIRAADAFATEMLPYSEDVSIRFVVVATGTAIQHVLAAMVDMPGLRDRTLAVLSVGGVIGGPERVDWMEAHFTHHELDTEVARSTAYLALQWLDRTADPPGAFGLPLAHARFPPARVEAMTEEKVQVVDLGPLPGDSDPPLVAQGLWAFVTAWVETHRL